MSEIKYEMLSQEDREEIEQEYYDVVVREFRGDRIEEGFYKYNVQLQDISFVTAMTDEEINQSAKYALDLMEELKAMNNDGMDTATFNEIYLKVGDSPSDVMDMIKVWNEFRSDNLIRLIWEIDNVTRVGGAYAALIANPGLINAIIVVYEKLVDNFDDEDLYVFAGYFLMRAIMRMHSEEVDKEEVEGE